MGKSVGKTVGRGVLAGVTGGISEFGQKNPFGAPINNPIHPFASKAGDWLGFNPYGSDRGDSTLSGDFQISPEEIARNQDAINSLGNRQYLDILDESKTQSARRKTNRDELASLLSRVSDKQFMRELPNIAEDANAGGVYTGTGFSEALAREKAKNAADIQDKLSLQSLSDLDAELALNNAALEKKQGFQSNALSRGFSLEDFIRSANVAKATGQALQPKTSGKSDIAALLSGAGAAAKGISAFA